LEKKGIAKNHSDEKILDYADNPDYPKKSIASANPVNHLNLKNPGNDGPATESRTIKKPDGENPDVIDSKYSGKDKESEKIGTKDQKPKNEIDDKMLVVKSQQGDKAAFEKLVRLYSKYVYTNAFFILRDSHDAEDVSQEVFVKVFLSIKNFRGLSSFKTWLRKLTINTCIDKLRIKSKTINKKISLETLEEGYEVVFTDLNHNTEKDFFSKETVKEVLNIIVNLEESYRVPLILRDLQDYSYREISILVKKPIGTIKTNIHRARKIIKDKMKYEKEKKV
jgi:RNA polymerase sigma-70 factor (ECF subfamily)